MAWRTNADPRRVPRLWVASLCSGIVLAISLTGSALAAPDSETNRARLDDTVRFLQDAQSSEGGFSAGGNPTEASDPDFTAWVALALAAAGINPRDQARPGGPSDYAYLVEHAGELRSTTDLERALLVVDASGTSPEDFGGVRLVQQILARQLADTREEGAFEHEAGQETPAVNDTIFAILALSPVQDASVQAAVKRAVSWLVGEQSPGVDGGWPALHPRTLAGYAEPDEVDMTGAAIQALNAAGLHNSEAQTRALGFLRTAQNPDGGFAEFPGEQESDTASTSWAVQAIWSAGENPETWVAPGTGKEPLGYLESMQHEDGSVQWKASSDENPMLMTAFAAPAYAGVYLPIPAPPYDPPPSDTPAAIGATPPSPGSAEAGSGGDAAAAGAGVIAGGGGEGARLFSRPQPDSSGHTRGGPRQPRGRTGPTNSIAAETPQQASAGAAKLTTGSPSPASGPSAGGTPLPAGDGSGTAGGQVVKGVLIATPTAVGARAGIEPGAPGLHSAGAGGDETPWLAIGIAGAIALLTLAGSQLERRRAQVIL